MRPLSSNCFNIKKDSNQCLIQWMFKRQNRKLETIANFLSANS
jgi:hypothetical protein